MSKIVFWSPLHGQGQTSNLHITALALSILHKKRILVMQTHFYMNNLEGPLVGKNVDVISEEDGIFQDIGLDAAIMYSRMNMLDANVLESCCITFPEISLRLLPGTETRNRETFDRDICSGIFPMIHQAQSYNDMVMIDANSGNNELSLRLMSSADMVIINMTQRRHVLSKFFSEYGERISQYKNVFFLFGHYDRNSGYNIINCRRKYRRYINKKNSGVIPYCTGFMDAQNESDILGMIRKGLREDNLAGIHKIGSRIKEIVRFDRYTAYENNYFFEQIRESTIKIINMLSRPEKRNREEGAEHETD